FEGLSSPTTDETPTQRVKKSKQKPASFASANDRSATSGSAKANVNKGTDAVRAPRPGEMNSQKNSSNTFGVGAYFESMFPFTSSVVSSVLRGENEKLPVYVFPQERVQEISIEQRAMRLEMAEEGREPGHSASSLLLENMPTSEDLFAFAASTANAALDATHYVGAGVEAVTDDAQTSGFSVLLDVGESIGSWLVSNP
ncbi:unnamed protein product, partial [Amoebophrya sp. A25]